MKQTFKTNPRAPNCLMALLLFNYRGFELKYTQGPHEQEKMFQGAKD